MDEDEMERNKLITLWHTAIKKGTDFDLWGQPVEATETYSRLGNHIKEEIKSDDSLFTDPQKKVLNKIVTCLDMRSKALQNLSKIEGISLEDLKKVELRLHSLLSSNCKDFPIDVTGIQMSMKERVITTAETDGGDSVSVNSSKDSKISELLEEPESIDDKVEARGSLLPALDPIPNKTLITVRIEKICLKDASQLIEPFLTISLKDTQCEDLCPSQDTAVAAHKDDHCIMFGTDVHIPIPLEDITSGFALFFELKHYKPKKQMVSVKCWAMMEEDEILEAPAVLEIYKKPTDFKRKRIHLMTTKPLYLHVKLIFNT